MRLRLLATSMVEHGRFHTAGALQPGARGAQYSGGAEGTEASARVGFIIARAASPRLANAKTHSSPHDPQRGEHPHSRDEFAMTLLL